MGLNQLRLKQIWDNWEVEVSILLSLLLQVILILSANIRKRSSRKLVAFVLWLAYIGADWVANYCAGNISSSINHPVSGYDPEMLAFWTPFLLLHLGGPDNITAFSLEDSQLWLRHLLNLILQVIASVYIFMKSLKPHSKLFIPTLFVFAAGFLKYGERTWSLNQASMNSVRKSLIKKRNPGPDYAAVMEDFSSYLRAGNPGMLTALKKKPSKPEHSEGGSYESYHFFQTFKCLFVDLILTFQDRERISSIFREYKFSQAYKMIETELSYAYDMFYTKALVVHSNLGRILRATSFCSILIAFCFFFSTAKGSDFKKERIIVSYVLLGGALTLELVSIGMLILSDWAVVMLHEANWGRLEKHIFQILSTIRFCKHRWSNKMGQYSLLSHIVDQKYQRWEIFLDKLGMKEMLVEHRYIEYEMVSEKLKDLTMQNLKDKWEKEMDQDERLNNRQGQWALKLPDECSMLQWSVDAQFDVSLIMWHLAIDICIHLPKKKNSAREDSKHYCKASKDLSHYLLYLLISRPFTMSGIAGLAVIRHGDTCEEAKNFFEEERVSGDMSAAVKSLMNVHTFVRAEKVKGDGSKSVLWDAVELARQLQGLGEDKMWETACNVWIEMLFYAARHCRGNYHAQTLSAGGELLTFAWLLEAHFGMGGHFQTKSGDLAPSFAPEM